MSDAVSLVNEFLSALEGVPVRQRAIPDGQVLTKMQARKADGHMAMVLPSDLRALVAEIERLREEVTEHRKNDSYMSRVCFIVNEAANGDIKVFQQENARLRGVLKTVHQDLIDRAAPDGAVAVGASVWIGLDDAVKGGA